MTASKFGYIAASAGGVAVTSGGDTTQDFVLGVAPTLFVNGVVKDGSGQGWPLYAKVVVTGPAGFVPATLYTDPVTGYYSISLTAGAAYEFLVTSYAPGYVAGGGPLVLGAGAQASGAAAAVVANWSLSVAPTCTAPGYGPGGFVGPLALDEGFDAGTLPAGWAVNTASGAAWEVVTGGDPCGQFDGNRTGGSGPYALVSSSCIFDPTDSLLVTGPIDLSGRTGAAIQWANDFINLDSGTQGAVDVSIDGGTSWTNVWQAPGDLPGPGTQIADMSFAAGQPNVKARFHYQGVWAWWWQVDDVEVGTFACTPIPGGLVVGTVGDANTGNALNGATVRNLAGGAPTATFATPEDPGQGDGFYILFSESGAQSLEAAYPAHDPQTKNKTVIPNSAVRVDFSLTAGLLDASPSPLSLVVAPGGAQDLTLTMRNTGTGDGSFVLRELDVPPPPQAPNRPAVRFDAAARRAALKRIPFNRMNDASTRGLPPPAGGPVNVPVAAGAGNVVASFPTGLAAGWGLTYDTGADRLWISNPDAAFFGHPGDGFEYQYLPDGTQTGDTIDIHDTGGLWQAEGTYNGRTGMMWGVNVGGDMCLFEMDPVAKAVTGKKICGPWPSSQRAVAYDYATDTYYVGGTNEATVYHVDGSGNLIDSAYIGLGISGLAYNPTTRHLFVASEFAGPFDIWVVDPANAYAILSGFLVTNSGVHELPDGGASLEADCGGHLWINDPTAQIVYEFESGETGWCANDIPWLSESPTSGTVPSGGGTLPVAVSFDSAGLLPGLRQGSLLFQTDTPTPVAPVPVAFTVLFSDVPVDSFAASYIYAAAGAGVMPGCAPQAPAFAFCPADVVTRRSMAGFIERAVHGALTPPPVYLGEFADVLSGSFNANYIQGLVNDQITAGCGGGNYCPDVPVTRAQMAVFVWKGQHGTQAPPPCSPPGTFADVPCPDGFAVDYIEGIAGEGVTAGCGNGNYCPNASITNAQMAVFMVKAFNLAVHPMRSREMKQEGTSMNPLIMKRLAVADPLRLLSGPARRSWRRRRPRRNERTAARPYR